MILYHIIFAIEYDNASRIIDRIHQIYIECNIIIDGDM
jgi:hypothetical protein